MIIPLIAEIGLNHFGNEKFLAEYLKVLYKKKIYGVSIQIPQESLMKKNQKKFLLDEKKISRFVKNAKKKFKLVGITTSDVSKVNFFENLNIDFFKVTSGMINNLNLIRKMQTTKIPQIYLSTGLISTIKLKEILNKLSLEKILLIHTSFEKKIDKINLNRINILRENFNLPICYGNHSDHINAIPNSVFFKPYSIFFYVKMNKKLGYPDNKHAIKFNELDLILNKVKDNISMANIV
jgi:N,N'-diacetyllegionaminate synthase